MLFSLAVVAASTASMVLRYAAAIFLVAVAIGLVYALIRLGKTLVQAEKLLGDVNTEMVPLLKQATETLDGVNTELDKLDIVMTSVVDVTEKVDSTARSVESAISLPAKKAAAFGAGVSHAMSSLFGRRAGVDFDDASWNSAPEREPASWATQNARDDEPAGSSPSSPAAEPFAGSDAGRGDASGDAASAAARESHGAPEGTDDVSPTAGAPSADPEV
jgi:hypothetical protein